MHACLSGWLHTTSLTCCLLWVVLQGEGAEAFILDLRINPGGLVGAGLQVARLFPDGQNVPIFNVSSFLPQRALVSGEELVVREIRNDSVHEYMARWRATNFFFCLYRNFGDFEAVASWREIQSLKLRRLRK